MKSTNNGGYRVATAHLLSPNKTSNARTEIYLIELLVKEVQWEFQTTQTIAKTVSCSSKSDSKSPLLKTIPIQIIEYEEVERVPT